MSNHIKTGKKASRAAVAVVMAAAMSVPVLLSGLPFRSSVGASAASYESEYETKSDIFEAQHELNRRIIEEGTVLLKNNNNALPLKGKDKKVTVLHSYFNPEDWSQSEGWMVLSGGGSGNIWTGSSPCPDTSSSHGCHTIYNGLSDHEYEYNRAMFNAYHEHGGFYSAAFCDANGPKMDIVKGQEASFEQYGGTAIITVSRIESESQDNYSPTMGISDEPVFERDPANPQKHYLQLRDNEKELIEYAKTKFGKVVVLLNTAAPIEVDYLNTSDSVDAVLWIGYPGESGLKDIPGVLDGSVSPSGRLVDTWAKDLTQDPTYRNFGDNSQVTDGLKANNTVLNPNGDIYYVGNKSDSKLSYHSVDYAESIYLGYRYYETKADIMDADSAGTGEAWYNDSVTYSFGYGLSYTSFTQEIVGTPSTSGDSVSFDVRVTNTGDVAGKEVVQVYYNPPYTEGGIEKATANLIAFEKTDVIPAGESRTVTVSFAKRNMSSWSLENGSYVLEDGEYEISLNKDSHRQWANFKYNHGADTVYDRDETTNTAYTKLFSGDDMYNVDKSKYSADGKGVSFMSRATGLELPETAGSVKFSAEALEYLDAQNTYVSTQDSADDPWVKDAVIPEAWTQGSEDYTAYLPRMTGKALNDPEWESFMNALSWEDMVGLVSSGLYSTPALDSIGKPKTSDTDGPAQIGSAAGERGYGWCSAMNISSTWNTALAEEFGEMIGEEAIHSETNRGVRITGWYGPGMNIHRSPFGGRNFEYYSEDGLLAGKIAAGTVRGAASRGLITYLKHLALNNQETDRTTAGGVCTWTNEQAMREIYLKPFEYAVKEGGATGMMCAFNRIGGIPAGANYNLFVNLLEKEWGFDGLAVTDYYKGSSWGWPGNMVVRCHMFPMGDYSEEVRDRRIDGEWNAELKRPVVDEKPQDALYYAVRTTAQRMLYTVANSNAVNYNQAFTDRSYTAILGSGVGYIPFGANLVRDVDGLTIEGKEGENYELAPGTTFYSPSGDFVGEFSKVGTYEFTANIVLNSDKWGEGKGHSWQAKLSFKVLEAFTIDEKKLTGNVNSPYEAQVEFIEYAKADDFGQKSIRKDKTFTATGLPEGLEISESGKITGIPKEEGEFEVKVLYAGKYEFDFTITIEKSLYPQLEFRVEGNELQWKYDNEDEWKTVVSLDNFKGEQGDKGDKGDTGAAGADGTTPTISINDQGYWVINGVATDVKAVGEKGEDGAPGQDAKVEISVNDEGYIVVNGEATEYKAEGAGCNGSIGLTGISIAAAGLLATGVAVHFARKKKKD